MTFKLHDGIIRMGVAHQRFILLFIAPDDHFEIFIDAKMPSPFESDRLAEIPIAVVKSIFHAIRESMIGQKASSAGGSVFSNPRALRELNLTFP